MQLIRILFVGSVSVFTALGGAARAQGDRSPPPSSAPSQSSSQSPSQPVPAQSAPAQAGAHAGDTTRTRQETPHYLKLGVTHNYGVPGMYVPGAPGTGGHFVGGGTGGVTTHFTRCYSVNGTEACNESRWIGFLGEQLSAAVAEVPEAKAAADRIALTTGMQAASMAATAVFLFSGVNVANGRKDEDGKVKSDLGPAALTLITLAGASFLSYVGWNIYEGHVAGKAVKLYNTGLGVGADASGRGANLDLSYRF